MVKLFKFLYRKAKCPVPTCNYQIKDKVDLLAHLLREHSQYDLVNVIVEGCEKVAS